jgi:hypothetical protein
VGCILAAIENALDAAEQEQSGLNERIEDVLARAAVTLGNGTDEYLERDARDIHYQDLFSAEISNGQRGLKELATEITHFKFFENGHVEPIFGFQAASRRVSSLRTTHLPHHWTSTLEELRDEGRAVG